MLLTLVTLVGVTYVYTYQLSTISQSSPREPQLCRAPPPSTATVGRAASQAARPEDTKPAELPRLLTRGVATKLWQI